MLNKIKEIIKFIEKAFIDWADYIQNPNRLPNYRNEDFELACKARYFTDEETQKMIDGILSLTKWFNLNEKKYDQIFLTLTYVLLIGKVQVDELRQLAYNLPTTYKIASKVVGFDLRKYPKDIPARIFLPVFIEKMNEDFNKVKL